LFLIFKASPFAQGRAIFWRDDAVFLLVACRELHGIHESHSSITGPQGSENRFLLLEAANSSWHIRSSWI